MTRRLQKIGQENALILDAKLMELAGLKEDQEFEVSVSNGSLILTPVGAPSDVSELDAHLEQVVNTRRDTLQKLAQ